jgi:hypothetical protein
MLSLPAAYRTDQNGHLFKRDAITGTVLVQPTVEAPPAPDEFKGLPAPKAKAILDSKPDETRTAAKKAEIAAKKTDAKAAADAAEKLLGE